MSQELVWLTATALMTALMWLPYVINRIAELGLLTTLGNTGAVEPVHNAWAVRAQRAHMNALEGLAIFATLVLAIQVGQLNSELTAKVAAAYFFVRAAHYVVYLIGVPMIRTLLFAAGLVCQIVLALVLLGMI